MDQNLIKIIQKYTSEIEVKPESDFQTDLALDSLQIVSLIVEIEDTYKISLPVPEMADVHTVKELEKIIEEKRKK